MSKPTYLYMPDHGSVPIKGFPAVVLDYRAEEMGPYRPSGEHVLIPGRYERDLVDWAKELASSSTQFVDCGAHAGSWSIVMALHFREVHAFEPQRLIFQQLCANAALNGLENVFAYNVGLDMEHRRSTLHRTGIDRGGSSAREDVVARYVAEGIPMTPEEISLSTLDSFASTLTNVGLIKIDVEGLELRVLRGAQMVLQQNNFPPMLIESWANDWYQADKKALLQFLEGLGYEVVPVNRYGDILLATSR